MKFSEVLTMSRLSLHKEPSFKAILKLFMIVVG